MLKEKLIAWIKTLDRQAMLACLATFLSNLGVVGIGLAFLAKRRRSCMDRRYVLYCLGTYNKRDGKKMMYLATAGLIAVLFGFIWLVGKIQKNHK